ncbi:hypothetical protein M413DRAFT_240231 [Hebeloma cylindrosporum]|uniref:Uncharacterized protein n=1 Tax=Hebeloma cylindrosporum TaxID=76867 RepID=A0A0C3C508_HEBCY|nr:hypothetical protein M413DRAFT_240231 [Hebeloma cylindrosporum h7]
MTSGIFEPLSNERIPTGRRKLNHPSGRFSRVRVNNLLPDGNHCMEQLFANLVADERIFRIDNITIAYRVLILKCDAIMD